MYKPKFTITSEILKNVGRVEAAKEVVDNAPLVPAWEAKFREEAIIRTVHHGTHLEGNALSYSEAEKAIQGKEVIGKTRDVQEVINYREVMDYIDKIAKTYNGESEAEISLTEGMYKEIHSLTVARILSEEEAGVYRKVKVVIRNTATGEITFRPPPPIEVPYLVEGYLKWLNSKEGREIHSVLRAGITHYELVRVHPFTDGNGRVARAMALMLMFLEGYQVKKFFSLEEYYDRDPQDYYDALRSVEINGGDLTTWLEYFTLGLAIELNRVKEMVQKLSLDLKLKAVVGKQIALSERQIKLIEYMERYGQMTMSDGREVLTHVSDDTVLRDLRDLVKKGLIVKKGQTKGARYLIASQESRRGR